MRLFKFLLFCMFLIFCFSPAIAQQGVVTGGNTISSGQGSVSFSMGLSGYQAIKSSLGHVSMGIQQAYDVAAGIPYSLSSDMVLKVFPNPTAGLFFIDFDESLQAALFTIEIYNLQGAIMKKEVADTGLNSFNLDELPAGAYLLRVSTPGKVGRTRIIKK